MGAGRKVHNELQGETGEILGQLSSAWQGVTGQTIKKKRKLFQVNCNSRTLTHCSGEAVKSQGVKATRTTLVMCGSAVQFLKLGANGGVFKRDD